MKNFIHIQGKTREEKLEYLNSLQYSVLLKRKKDKFYLMLPEIALVAVNDSLEEAYKDLLEQKRNFFGNILDCEAEDEIIPPRETYHGHETIRQLKMFTYKLLIVCFLAGLTLTISGALISHKVASISGERIAKEVVNGIIGEAKKTITNTSEGIDQEKLKKLHQIVEKLRPVAKEVRTLFPPSSCD